MKRFLLFLFHHLFGRALSALSSKTAPAKDLWRGFIYRHFLAKVEYLILGGVLFLVLIIGLVGIFRFYTSSFDEQKVRLIEIVRTQARLMEEVARFDLVYSHDYPQGATKATLSQIIGAFRSYRGVGKSGEFILVRRVGEQVEYILRRSQETLETPPNQSIKEAPPPVQKALQGQSGTMVMISDGKEVLTAFEPVAVLNLGFVASIDVDEIRRPFLVTGFFGLAMTLMVILLGTIIFLRISQRVNKEIAARETRFRLVTESVKEAIIACNSQGEVEFWNKGAEKIFGFSKQEIRGQPVTLLLPKKMHPQFYRFFNVLQKKNRIATLLSDKKELLAMRRNQEVFPCKISLSTVKLNEREVYLGVLRDITERKKSQQWIEHLKDRVESEERKRLAIRLHDGLGQDLLALQLGLKMIILRVQQNQPLDESVLHSMSREVAEMIYLIRDMIEVLQPTFLERMGLVDAIRWWGGKLCGRSGLAFEIVHEGEDFQKLEPRVIYYCFRSVQEALTNTVKHASASKISVRVRCKESLLKLIILDDGQGADFKTLSSEKEKKSGVGLSIIQERTHRIGGKVKIDTAPGCGVQIQIVVPYDNVNLS
ncbi:PAS domain S-box protein [Magnetococcales bacterium HHB-1]